MIFLAIIIPLIGTTIGSMFVILLKKNINHKWIMLLEGFAAGVMLAASIWSLLIPSLDLSKTVIPTVIGFILGMNLLLIFEVIYKKNKDINMLNLAVIIHNIPEGLSVGVAIAAALNNDIILMYYINPLMPYFLSFAAGAMVYVVVSELIPSCNSIYGNIGLCIGFIIMMFLDVLFS